MPLMDGLQLAEAIHDDPLLSTKVVLLTGFGQRGQARAARQVGVDGFLTKPVRPGALRACIATVIAGGNDHAATGLVTRHTLAEAEAQARHHVLVVDDNTVNQMVAVRMLERLGHRADVASNGLEAVEAVDRVHYAAVLMDCRMPVMDGYEATREIRRRRPHDRLPIIALTGNAIQEEGERMLQAGMDDHLLKPVRLEALAAALGRWIDPEAPGSGTERHPLS